MEKVRSFLSDITQPNSQSSTITSAKPILIFGNWSANKNMKHMISTPGVGLKRFLLRHFKAYDIDEFRTSILNYKTKERNENLYLPGKGKIHSVLTYKMENGRIGCINRDKNAVYNMREIVNSILQTGDYPHVFKRSTNLTNAVNLPGMSNNGTSIPEPNTSGTMGIGPILPEPRAMKAKSERPFTPVVNGA